MSEERDKIVTYKSNSFASKTDPQKDQREKKVEKVISGDAKVKKRGFFGKLRDSLISSDDTKSVGSYIASDILIPSIKKAISDIVTTGIDMILYGESRHQTRSNGSKVSYQNYYDRDRSYNKDRGARVSTVGTEVKDIVVSSRGDAESVLGTLEELISQYDVATVSDFYDIVGITGSYTDNYYGWTSLAGAKTRPVRDGWVILMPKPEPIGR